MENNTVKKRKTSDEILVAMKEKIKILEKKKTLKLVEANQKNRKKREHYLIRIASKLLGDKAKSWEYCVQVDELLNNPSSEKWRSTNQSYMLGYFDKNITPLKDEAVKKSPNITSSDK